MATKGKKDFVYEGFTLPRLTIKKLLASNARGDSELQNFRKQLDKEKEELESDFSKTRSHLLSRAFSHQMILEGESYDDCRSDEEHNATEDENRPDDHIISSETASFVTLKDISSSQDALDRNSKNKHSWADKVAYFEQSLATKNEPVTWKPQQATRKISWAGRANVYVENVDAKSAEQLEQRAGLKTKPTEATSKSHNNRKISWGGRANVYIENWEATSEVSRASSEENLSSRVTCSRGDITHVRVRKHAVAGRSRSFTTTKHTGLTKEALQKHSSSTSKQLARRHTVCCRPKRIEPVSGESCPDKKPLSDLLPPIKLPPIYLQETRSKVQGVKGDKHVVNNHAKNGVSKSFDTKCSTEDLHYCRYLRIKRTDSEEYTL